MNRRSSSARALSIHFWRMAGFCSTLILAAGCAMPISVKYSPLAATESVVSGPVKPRAYVMRFTDARPKKDQIGAMKDVWGATVKSLVTTDEFGLILAEATTDALRKAGLEADLHSDRAANDTIPPGELGADYVIGGKMTGVEVISQPGWDTVSIKAHVVIDVYVRKGESTPQWIGPIEGTAERREIKEV